MKYWHQEGKGAKIFIIHQNQRFLKQVFLKRLSQDRLDPVFNKGQNVSLCEFVHRTSTCFRCYPSNQKLHDNNQQEHPYLIPYTLKKLKRPLSSHSFDYFILIFLFEGEQVGCLGLNCQSHNALCF